MSDYVDCIFCINSYKVRKENDVYIVLFNNIDDYFVVNETGILIINFIRNNDNPTLKTLKKYLENEFSKLSQSEMNFVMDFLDKMVKTNILKIN